MPFAILALLVAVAATAVSIYALDVAREAKSAAAIAAGGATAVPQEPAAAPEPTLEPVPSPTPPPTTPPAPQYIAERVRANLQLPAAQGCGAVYVDVDTLEVGALTGHEFYLSACLGSQVVRIDRTSGATPTSPNPTPEVCAAQLAGTSTANELVLQTRVGQSFCLITNLEDAQRQRIPQRIALVEITEVSSGEVTMVISTYRVPTATTTAPVTSPSL